MVDKHIALSDLVRGPAAAISPVQAACASEGSNEGTQLDHPLPRELFYGA